MTGACFRRSAAAQVMEATLNTQDKPDGDWDLDGLLEMMDDAAPSGDVILGFTGGGI